MVTVARGYSALWAFVPVGAVEQLDVDAVGIDEMLDQGVASSRDELDGATEEPVVDRLGHNGAREPTDQLVPVDVSAERGRVPGVARVHVEHLEALAVLALETLERVLEHRRLGAAVAVDQRENRRGLDRQGRLEHGQDRRDPASRPQWPRSVSGRTKSRVLPKLPVGVITSRLSPAFNPLTANVEKAPPSMCLTPIASSAVGPRSPAYRSSSCAGPRFHRCRCAP